MKVVGLIVSVLDAAEMLLYAGPFFKEEEDEARF